MRRHKISRFALCTALLCIACAQDRDRDQRGAAGTREGKFSHEVAADNAELAADALEANPEVKAVFAPDDELTKGTVTAIERTKQVVFPANVASAAWIGTIEF